MSSHSPPSGTSGATVRSHFIRGRNLLLVQGDLQPLFTALEQFPFFSQAVPDSRLLPLFRRFLATFALHLVSKPRNHVLAWTVNFQDPTVNFFASGDTELDTIVGRFFTDHVVESDHNSFYQEWSGPSREVFRSYVDFQHQDPLRAAEIYYGRSEQLPARYFHLGGSVYAMLCAHPDWDEAWFWGVTGDDVSVLADQQDLVLIEERTLQWSCGCTENKLLSLLQATFQANADDLFEGDEVITAVCPRCATNYRVTRETMEAFCHSGK